MLFISYNTKQIKPAYISKYNSNRETQVMLLMITDNNKKWRYLFVKRLSALLKWITSKDDGYSYCLNWLYSFATKYGLKEHENICKDHDCCHVEMSDKDNNMSKYNSGENTWEFHLLCML